MSDALETLAAELGIAAAWHDIWGGEHGCPPATRRAVLAAMGYAAGDEEAAEALREQRARRQWRRGAPPVVVAIRGEDRARLRITAPARVARHGLRFRIVTEAGAARAGRIGRDAATERARRDLDGEPWVALECTIPVHEPPGYHALELAAAGGGEWSARTRLVVAPERAYRPPSLDGDGRTWGFAAQLYALRSARNWGIGDFTDLLRLVEFAASAGAGVVGVSPLHALFPHAPSHASPYSPSSRLFLNTLHLDVEAIPELDDCAPAKALVASAAFQARLRGLRAGELVDYDAVAACKSDVLALLHAHFHERHLGAGDARANAFRAFQRRGGTALRRHALHEALQAHLHAQDPRAWGWPAWPEALRDPDGDAVAAFAREHALAVEAREYAQWLAHEQLDGVHRRADELGLAIGLYRDLAVGVDAGGSETWSRPAAFAMAVRTGAPPDDFNLAGQDWGLPPWRPEALRDDAYRAFISVLRANMRAAGALRIDHVLGLARQFWIPAGEPAANGAYVRFPLRELMGVLALESHRQRCLVVGEDLGTVPDEVREALAAFDVLSYRVLLFAKGPDGAFLAPDEYPARALACVSTHDLPTLAGFWGGADVELRRELGLFPDPRRHEDEVVARAEDRARLLIALEREGLLPGDLGTDPQAYPEMTPELAIAIHRFLARTPCRVFTVQLEDLLGQLAQMNLPGTTDAHPNWRRRLPLAIEAWPETPRVQAMVDAMRAERGARAAPAEHPAPAHAERAPVPGATYRVQLTAERGFDHAASLAPYLDALGVSHVYCSPYLQARAGSTHGYDIRDHAALSAELGGDAAFARFAAALAAHGMSQVMDVVPNHMGIMGGDNAWWLDVLAHGPASPHAEHFDIDWAPLKEALRGKVLVPVLGDRYGNVLDSGDLVLTADVDEGTLAVCYFEHRFPLDPRTYPRVLGRQAARLAARLGEDDPARREFESLLTSFAKLPPRDDTRPAAIAERARDSVVHRARLAALWASSADLRAHVDAVLREVNGDADYPADRALLHELLEAQAYRLAHWRVAADDINYRRFFDINDLAALRMERGEVFDATHRRVLELVARGEVTGLRIDHPDGLHDPAAYFARLQREAGAVTGRGGARPVWMVAEKILASDEDLPGDWAVHGATGYEFAAVAGGLFVDPAGADALERTWQAFTGDNASTADVEYHARRQVVEDALSGELHVLSRELSRLAESDPGNRDFTEHALRRTLTEVVACFPVYRTYVDAGGATARDEAVVDRAVAAARQRARGSDASVFDFVRDALLARVAAGRGEALGERALRFAMRFQQFSAPVAAKGVEDTAFYRHHRLASLNEVGDDPARFATSPAALHRALAERARRWPHALSATSTHDSKRSLDVRMRLHVLSEVAPQWTEHVTRWSAANRRHKHDAGGDAWPEPHTEYALYQSLLGVWPLAGERAAAAAALRPRLATHARKSAREAKRHTSWSLPDADYEAALDHFVDALLDARGNAAFLDDFLGFHAAVARAGLWNSLALNLLTLTAPGVPDLYQGNELWRFDLVDPDNRRDVDFARRGALLDELERHWRDGDRETLAADLLASPEDGRIKLHVIRRALAQRRARSALFEDGAYEPLAVTGARAGHLFAFARRHGDDIAVTLVPRLVAALAPHPAPAPVGAAIWRDTRVQLPAVDRGYVDCFTGRALRAAADGTLAADVLARFPVALLAPAC